MSCLFFEVVVVNEQISDLDEILGGTTGLCTLSFTDTDTLNMFSLLQLTILQQKTETSITLDFN
jgi:hypothetical protein